MHHDELTAIANAARTKFDFLKNNSLGYFLASMLSGIYVGFGITLIFTIGGLLNGLPHARIIMGVSFGIALSLVVMAGSELFTGNNLAMTIGILSKTVTWKEMLKLGIVCYIGNWLGSVLLGFVFFGTELANGPAVSSLPLLPQPK